MLILALHEQPCTNFKARRNPLSFQEVNKGAGEFYRDRAGSGVGFPRWVEGEVGLMRLVEALFSKLNTHVFLPLFASKDKEVTVDTWDTESGCPESILV